MLNCTKPTSLSTIKVCFILQLCCFDFQPQLPRRLHEFDCLVFCLKRRMRFGVFDKLKEHHKSVTR